MNEQTARKVPQIRFKGFEDGWLEDQLGERVEFFSGLTYSPGNVQKGVGTLVLRSSNVKNGEIVNADNVYVDPKIVNSKNVEVGDIAVVVRNGSRSLIGKHAQIKNRMDNTVIGAFMTGIHSENPAFTNALLDTPQFDKEIAKNLGATINQITTGAFRQMTFRFPRRTEQTQIGEYFRELDRLIGLHQRKHDKLVTLKKAMLQKMFPQPGATTPEIRFKGFAGDWMEKKMGEVGAFNPKEALPEVFEYVDLESVVGTEMVNHRTETRKTAPSRAQRLAQQGDLFFQTVRPYQKNNHLFTLPFTNYVFSTGYAQIRPFNDGSFLLGLMQRDQFVKVVLDHCTGTSYPAINSNVLAEILVMIPAPEEQQKIGTYFRQFDELISRHAIQLQKLKQIKSACLEKMFI